MFQNVNMSWVKTKSQGPFFAPHWHPRSICVFSGTQAEDVTYILSRNVFKGTRWIPITQHPITVDLMKAEMFKWSTKEKGRHTHTHKITKCNLYIVILYYFISYFVSPNKNATHLIFWPLLTSRASRLMESAQKNSARLRLESPRWVRDFGRPVARFGGRQWSLKLHDPTMDQWIS